MAHDRKHADLYRMVMPDHICPYGLKSLHLLRARGYEVTDHHLTTRAETDAFKAEHGVATTPQTFIDGERIGGHDELQQYVGLSVRDPEATSYTPVLAIFAVALLLALAIGFLTEWQLGYAMLVPHFVAIAMVLLALQKLKDIEAFATMFLNYDLLAQRWVPYGRVYPFGELIAGVLMVVGVLPWLSGTIALFIGVAGGVSVFKAVYIDKRELKCACVGGDTNVPLGFVSLTENIMMAGMGIWVLSSLLY